MVGDVQEVVTNNGEHTVGAANSDTHSIVAFHKQQAWLSVAVKRIRAVHYVFENGTRKWKEMILGELEFPASIASGKTLESRILSAVLVPKHK
jgi:hypothetical protein